MWTGNGTFEGKMAVYSCNAGYQIQGTANRTCGSDGFWSGSAPTCLPIGMVFSDMYCYMTKAASSEKMLAERKDSGHFAHAQNIIRAFALH